MPVSQLVLPIDAHCKQESSRVVSGWPRFCALGVLGLRGFRILNSIYLLAKYTQMYQGGPVAST